jgi:osmoprotectant transport system substrate-binding protein
MQASRRFFLKSAVAAAALFTGCRRSGTVVVGSKNFTEQLVLGELLAQQLESAHVAPVERKFYLAGTFICHQALIGNRIDTYVEYTGTALTAIFKQPAMHDSTAVLAQVRKEYAQRFNIAVLQPLGFNNSFALVMRGSDARQRRISHISDLSRYAGQLRLGIGYEFQDRRDGLRGLTQAYDLRFAAAPQVMDLGLLYRALQDERVDVVVGSSTDGLISAWHLTVLADDRRYFPPYDAIPVVRDQSLRQHAAIRPALMRLAGQVSATDMQQMNYAVDGQHEDAAEVVRAFRKRKAL